ncbi:Putative phosphatidic acid phosphatase type 2/haloperoxidase, dolichyldiphosphatase 1 [Septoria linicola]|uniref:Dolichyldiphosphatase n=1 Tax=Septoria linicola TaxID=215465 RepID=A0A9Q9AVT5_9PEZI|nr:putative phosphatidic acid phosphatase type 2/haloperoxidase, dolichyldiphosphatase 1 [Septoria linicola]USW53023.1 Putative phosphatidic acid phosphatase type 2/haloperoxidase, dolichyldiphosphatase 1 [Septoria linicola]
MDHPSLTSLSLTHVNYDPNDTWSWVSAHLALVPQALIISYVTLVWATREIEVLIMFAGQLGCEALNWILKRYFREARPTEFIGKGYGMPSSHAQYAVFFSVYLSLFLLLRHDPVNHPSASSTHIPTPFWQRLGLAVLSLLSAAAVAHSRIYLNYHSPKQVFVGCVAGAGCAVAWFIATAIARRLGIVEWALELTPVKWLRMRDLVVSESLEDAGWERYQAALKRRANLSAKKSR